MEKKYKLTDETIEFNGVKLHRIEALRDLVCVKKGDKGGFVQSEKNLSQFGNCWIFDDSKAIGNSHVLKNAVLSGNSIICDNAVASEFSWIFSHSIVCEKALISNNARIYYNSVVCGNSYVAGDAKVTDFSRVEGLSEVTGNAEIRDALIKKSSDYMVFKNWWSSLRHFTWTRSNNMWKVGCFYGTGEELIEKAYKDSELSGREYKRVVDYVESTLRDEIPRIKTSVHIKEIFNL